MEAGAAFLILVELFLHEVLWRAEVGNNVARRIFEVLVACDVQKGSPAEVWLEQPLQNLRMLHSVAFLRDKFLNQLRQKSLAHNLMKFKLILAGRIFLNEELVVEGNVDLHIFLLYLF